MYFRIEFLKEGYKIILSQASKDDTWEEIKEKEKLLITFLESEYSEKEQIKPKSSNKESSIMGMALVATALTCTDIIPSSSKREELL